jgi:diaminohydroxyphosphoribosylaminopyrimidine deaminase/5-amino-6-(5-phosphoribosylamino)uracil reductase
MYVTLEPCSHQGKSPPCADAIIKAGIARVVSALQDPNPEVAGQGHERLRAKGIVVDIGLGADEARRAHVGHITRVQKARPHVMLKLAVSADGKVGLAGRKPVALTGEVARARVFQMRSQCDAILVGIGTVLSDNPQLNCRLPGMLERSPVRVVLDAQLRLPLATSVVATVRETPSWVFTSRKPSAIAEEILQQKGCKVFRVGDRNGRLNLDEVLKVLAEQGITRLMVEGGPIVAAAFVAADLVDEAVLLRAEKTIGADGIDALEGMALSALTERLHARGAERLGADTIETFERTSA